MWLLNKFSVLTVLFSLFISCNANSFAPKQQQEIPIFDSKKTSVLDKKISMMQSELNVPNVGVGIIKNGKIINTKVYGKLQSGKDAPQNTLFSVASISKVVFSTLVMKLVQQGKWDLDQPLYKYHIDPDVSDDPLHKKITSRHALSHQGGFINQRRFHSSGRLKFDFKPGTDYRYSGEGMFYVQRAIEKKFGKSLDELAEEFVLFPTGMKDTRYAWDGKKDSERFSRWFDVDGNEYDENYAIEARSGSSMITTIDDLTTFGVEILNNKAGLNDKVFKQMVETQRRINPNLEQAIGWRVINNLQNGEYAIQHGGNHRGVSAMIVLLPKSKDGIVVMSNSFNGFMLVNEVVREFLPQGREIMHRAYRQTKLNSLPKIYDIDEKTLNSYLGVYKHPNGRKLEIKKLGKRLQTSMSRTRDYIYFAESDEKFFQKDLDTKLEFTKDKEGKVISLSIITGNNTIKLLRQNNKE